MAWKLKMTKFLILTALIALIAACAEENDEDGNLIDAIENQRQSAETQELATYTSSDTETEVELEDSLEDEVETETTPVIQVRVGEKASYDLSLLVSGDTDFGYYGNLPMADFGDVTFNKSIAEYTSHDSTEVGTKDSFGYVIIDPNADLADGVVKEGVIEVEVVALVSTTLKAKNIVIQRDEPVNLQLVLTDYVEFDGGADTSTLEFAITTPPVKGALVLNTQENIAIYTPNLQYDFSEPELIAYQVGLDGEVANGTITIAFGEYTPEDPEYQ